MEMQVAEKASFLGLEVSYLDKNTLDKLQPQVSIGC